MYYNQEGNFMFPGHDPIITPLVSLASHVYHCIRKSQVLSPKAHIAEPHA